MFFFYEVYFWVAFFAYAIIFGAATSYLAGQKNKNKTTWFFVGALLGFIGLIIIAASKPEGAETLASKTGNINYSKNNVKSEKTNKLPVRYIDLDSPVEVAEVEIKIEENTNIPYLNVGFRNLSNKVVTAVKFKAICFDSFKEPVDEPPNNEISLTLQDQSEQPKNTFGSNKNYPLSVYPTTRIVDIVIEVVGFEDGTQWKKENEDLKEVKVIPKIDDTKLNNLREVAGKDALTYPYEDEGTWICVCGRPNKKDDRKCVRCDREKDKVFSEYNGKTVEKRIKDKREKTKKEKEKEKNLIHEKRKRTKKIGIVISATLILIVALSLLTSKVFLPMYRDNNKYISAEELYEEGKYVEAIELYEELGDYKDSRNKVNETKYTYGEKLFNDEKYSLALSIYEELGDYKDSRNKVNETKYTYGEKLFNDEKYSLALRRYEELGDYKDSEIKMLESKYEYADKKFDEGEYDEAIAIYDDTNLLLEKSKHLINDDDYKLALAILYKLRNHLEVNEYLEELSIEAKNSNEIQKEYFINLILNNYNTNNRKIIETDTGIGGTILGIKSDGKVFRVHENGQSYEEDWRDIIAIESDRDILGLKSDGTVVTLEGSMEGWKDISAIASGFAHTVGLKSDGTVAAILDKETVNFVESYKEFDYDGQCDVESWRDIVAISAGSYHTVGLRSDGRVVAVGSNLHGQCDIESWRDIVAISAGESHTVGLKSDGGVVAVGSNFYGQCDIESWRDIVAISAGDGHTVGLKSDGLVAAVGDNKKEQCEVESWTDIIAIEAEGDNVTLGLKSDGSMIKAGTRISSVYSDKYNFWN